MSITTSVKPDKGIQQSNEVSMSPIDTLNGMKFENFKSVLSNVSIQDFFVYPANTGESWFNYIVFEFDTNGLNDSNVTLNDAKSAILALFWKNAEVEMKIEFNEKKGTAEKIVTVISIDDESPLTYHEVPKENLAISEKENELVLAILGQEQDQRIADFNATRAKLGNLKRRFGI